MQSKISELHHRKLRQLLNEALDEVIPENQYLQIEKLELELGDLEQANWQEKIAQELRKSLKKEVRSASATAAQPEDFSRPSSGERKAQPRMTHFSSEAEKKQELLFYFLVNGRLPWWWKSDDRADFKSILQQLLKAKKEPELQRFREALAVAPEMSSKRLVEHFSLAQIQKLIRLLFLVEAQTQVFKAADNFLQTLTKLAAVGETRLMMIFHQKLLLSFASGSSTKKWAKQELETEVLPKVLVAVVNTLLPSSKIQEMDFEQELEITKAPKEAKALFTSLRKQLRDEKNQPASAKKARHSTPSERKPGPAFFTKEDKSGIPVSNAGVVLLYPYLKQFFSDEKLLDAKKLFRDEGSQVRAIHLLHYLCKGAKAEAEHELTLNKLLCNWELEEPLPMDIEISDKTKERISDLLHSAVKNWSALKSTSPEGFRQAFLQREGLLYRDERTLIRIERQTHDILLNRLPYTLSMFKLPWLDRMIHVEW